MYMPSTNPLHAMQGIDPLGGISVKTSIRTAFLSIYDIKFNSEWGKSHRAVCQGGTR
jgi:hypothetical protein